MPSPARGLQDMFFTNDPPQADRTRDDPTAEAAMDSMEASGRDLYLEAASRRTKSRNYEGYWNNVRSSDVEISQS